MDPAIIEMLQDALARTERGEILGLAIVAAGRNGEPLIGYLDRDQSTAMIGGSIELAHHLTRTPQFEEALDPEFPARRLAVLD